MLEKAPPSPNQYAALIRAQSSEESVRFGDISGHVLMANLNGVKRSYLSHSIAMRESLAPVTTSGDKVVAAAQDVKDGCESIGVVLR